MFFTVLNVLFMNTLGPGRCNIQGLDIILRNGTRGSFWSLSPDPLYQWFKWSLIYGANAEQLCMLKYGLILIYRALT